MPPDQPKGTLSGCPSDTYLLAAKRGELDPDEASEFGGHLSACTACRGRYDLAGPPPEQSPAGTTDRFVRGNLVSPRPGLDPPLVDGDLGSIGNIRLLRELGAGGTGAVYQGRKNGTDECLAVKVLHGRADGELRERVRREGEVAASLKETPHVVRVVTAEYKHTPPYLTMDYIAGETLEDRLVRIPGGRLAGDEAARVARDIARGLEELHRQSFVHQDVKPSNVYLPEPERGNPCRPRRPHALLLDLGSAFRFGHHGPPRSRTKEYASPEQQKLRSADIGPATDLFSLGVTLHRMLVGQLPPTRDPAELRRRLGVARIHPTLARLCAGCLSPTPLDRPTAGQVVHTLTRHLGRRRRLWNRIIYGALVFVAVFIGGGLLGKHHAHRQEVERANRANARLSAVEDAYGELFQRSERRAEQLTGRITGPLAAGNGELLAVPWLTLDEETRGTVGRLRTALDELEAEPGAAGPEAAAVVPVVRGVLALLDRRFEEALGHLPPEAVARIADTPVLAHRAHLVRGAALGGLKRPAEAAVEFRAAAELDPDSFFATRGLAEALVEGGQKQEAVETWGRYAARLKAALGPDLKPGRAATRLALSLIGKAAIESDLGPVGVADALGTVIDAELLIAQLAEQNVPRLEDLRCVCVLFRFEFLLELGDRKGAFEAARTVVVLHRDRGDRQTFKFLLNAAQFVGRLERLRENATGQDRAEACTLLGAAYGERALIRLEREEFAEAIADADRAMAITETELRGVQSGALTRLDLILAHAVRAQARWSVGRSKLGDPTPGAVEGWVRLALADADKVVGLAEEGARRGEPADPDLRRQMDGQLGAILWRRGRYHTYLGDRTQAAVDFDRSVEILGRVATHPHGGQWVVELQGAVECRARFASGDEK